MARHYSTRDFFRQMPTGLLARYFHARGVFDELEMAAMPESHPDALFAAWQALDDPPAPDDGHRVPRHRGTEL